MIDTMDTEGYIVRASSGAIVGICSNQNRIYARRSNQEISQKFMDFLVAIEDKRFYKHFGFDTIGITRALIKNIRARKIIEGGSTITQQFSRAELNDNSKTIKRKIKELYHSILLETKNTKNEIIKKYIEAIYMGSNIYGFESASLKYFSKRLDKLNTREYISLIVLLRGPNLYLKNHSLYLERYKNLVNRLNKAGLLSKQQSRKYLKYTPKLKKTSLNVIPSYIIPSIATKIDQENLTAYTSIDIKIQKKLDDFIRSTNDMDSVICIAKGKITGFASKYGSHYPFKHFGNIGSTLKPFIYLYLRSNGIEKNEQIQTTPNYEYKNWKAGEAYKTLKKTMTLSEALEVSNNTVFLNASYQIGFEKVSEHISKLFNKKQTSNFPSAILGSTPYGVSLYELSMAYYNLLSNNNCYNDELKEILRQVSINTVGISSLFCKTGTTNSNENRYIILGNSEMIFAFLRDEKQTYETLASRGKTTMSFSSKVKGLVSGLFK